MQAMQAAHHDKTEENEIIVPESPEEYQQQIAKPLSDECPQLPLTPGAAAKHQQLQFSSPQHHHRTTSYLQQQSKTGKKFNLNAAAQQARGSSGTAAVKLSAESTATGDQDRGAAPDTEDSQTSSDSDESEEDDGCAGDDASDADWSPQQPSSKPCKGPRSRAQHRTPIKTPNKHPFPQIQHDPEQIKRLTSPTKNRNIAECFAAIASLQRDKAHTPKKTPTQAQQAAAATGGDGAAVPGGSVMTGTKGHNDNNQPAKVLTAAAAAAVGNEVTVDLISDGSGNNSDSDVEITGEVLSQQQQDQQQQTQQQRHTSLKHTSGDMATQTRRNLSVTRIREQAAAAKAAKLAGMLTGDSQQQNLKPTQYQAAAINASAATPASAAAASHKEGKVASSIQTAQDPIPLSDPVTKDTMLRQYESMAAAVTSHAATAAGRHISTVQTPAPVPGAVKDELTFMHSSQPFTPDKNTAGRTPISQQQQQQLAQHIAQELLFDSFDTRQAERASDNEKPATHLKRAACLQSDAAASDDSSRKRQRTLNQHTADPQVPTQHTAAVATRDKLAIPCDRSLLQTVELQVQTGFARQGMQNSTAATAAPPVVVIDTPGVQQTITTYVIRALGGSSQQDMVHCEPDNGLLCGPIAVDDTATTKQAEHQAQLPYRLVCVPASQGIVQQQPAVVGNCAGTAAAAAAAGSGRDPQMMQCQKRCGKRSAPEAAAAPTAAPNADSTSASSSGVTGHESVVTTEVAGDDDLQVHAAAVADTAAAGRDLQSTSSLVLDHIQLLPSDHLTSWPSVKIGQKRVLPRFTFTAAARAHLMGLVNSRPERTLASHTKLRSPARAHNRRKKGKQRRGRGRATGAAAAAVGSPQAAASDGGDDEGDGLPFPDLLDAEKGVYMDWKTVPRGEVVYMEYMADGQVFHQFKQQYTDIFYNATKRQQLSSNILVGVADPCHPCNHNPLEPLLSHQQCLEQLQQHYKQAQQQQLQGLPLEQPDKQPSRAACQQVLLSGVADQQQHAVGRLLLAARDLDVCELLGMYIPGKSGYMLTSEDDERTKVDLTSEAIMFPYQMTFDFHKPAECDLPGGQDDFVMCEADPSSCIMALINDSTEWAQQMEKLGMSCPRKAQLVPGSCTCHKYKGRSNNTFIVQCVYKAHDDTPVPVALFFTSRPVLEREELLWSYDGEGGEAGAYFGNQKVDRAQRTYVQLEGALRQMTVQWLQEHLQQLCQFLPQQAATQAAPAAAASQSTAVLESAKQHIGRLQARFLVTEYVGAKLAYLRSSCLVDRLLGPAPECDREVAAAVAAAFPAGTTAASSSDNTGKRSRVRQGLQGRQQALIKHMVERRAHTLDPVAAVNVALSDGQLAGQELPPRWRAMLERLQQQLQQQGLQQQAVQQDLQQLQVVMQQCLLQSVQESTSNTAAAGALQVDAAKVLCTNDEQQDRIQQQCPQQGVQQEGHQEGLKQHANVQGTTSVAHGVASVDSAAASAPSTREADEPGSAMPGGELTAVRKQLAAVTEQCRFLEQLLQAKTMECDGLKEELQASRHM